MKPFVPIQNVTEDLVVFKLFITRLISGVIVLAIAVAAMLLGGNILFAFVALISMIGLFELYRASGIEKKGPAIAGYIGALLFMFSAFRSTRSMRFFVQWQDLLMWLC